MAYEPSAKRLKHTHNPSAPPPHPLLPRVQEINSKIQQLKLFVDTLQNNNHFLDQSEIIVGKLCSDLSSIVGYVEDYKSNNKASQLERIETVAHTIQPHLSTLVPAMSMLYLASTSKKMFELLSPYICNTVLFTIQESRPFKHWQPTRISTASITAIPPNVTEIQFHSDFNEPLHNLPPTITHITLGDEFNCSVSHTLPPRLTHLAFGANFNHSADYLPHTLTHLAFGQHFTHSVDRLPPSLVFLEFEYHNQLINALPVSLHTLKFSSFGAHHCLNVNLKSLTSLKFTAKIQSELFPEELNPPHLTHFTGDCWYFEVFPPFITHATLHFHNYEDDQEIDFSLLTSLKELVLEGGWNNNHKLNSLPTTLSKLKINCPNFSTPLDHLPPSLTYLKIAEETNFHLPLQNLPHTLVELHIKSDKFDQHIDLLNFTFLTHLTYGYQWDNELDKFPPSLTHLAVGDNFFTPIPKLPPKLTHLSFGKIFDEQVDNLPPSLTHLTFGESFDQHVYNLPPSITHLTFGADFNQNVDHLPPHLVFLLLGENFNQKIDRLPPTLQTLHILGPHFSQSLALLPPGLTHIFMAILPIDFCFPTSLQEAVFTSEVVICHLHLWKHTIFFESLLETTAV